MNINNQASGPSEREKSSRTVFSILTALYPEEVLKHWKKLRGFTRTVLKLKSDYQGLAQFNENNKNLDRTVRESSGELRKQNEEVRAFSAWASARQVATSLGNIALWEMPLIPVSSKDREVIIKKRKERIELQFHRQLRRLLGV